jgi:hypothetical protein
VGLLCVQNDDIAGEAIATVPDGNFQSAQPGKFQYAESDYVYTIGIRNKNFWHCGSYHQHFNNITSNSVRTEVDLVKAPAFPARPHAVRPLAHAARRTSARLLIS